MDGEAISKSLELDKNSKSILARIFQGMVIMDLLWPATGLLLIEIMKSLKKLERFGLIVDAEDYCYDLTPIGKDVAILCLKEERGEFDEQYLNTLADQIGEFGCYIMDRVGSYQTQQSLALLPVSQKYPPEELVAVLAKFAALGLVTRASNSSEAVFHLTPKGAALTARNLTTYRGGIGGRGWIGIR